MGGGHTQYFHRLLEAVAESTASTSTRRGETLTAKQQKILLYGISGKVTVKYKNRYGRTRAVPAEYEGVIP